MSLPGQDGDRAPRCCDTAPACRGYRVGLRPAPCAHQPLAGAFLRGEPQQRGEGEEQKRGEEAANKEQKMELGSPSPSSAVST